MLASQFNGWDHEVPTGCFFRQVGRRFARLSLIKYNRHSFMKTISRPLFALLTVLLFVSTSLGEIRFAGIFSDHMVLQREQKVPVWGWGDVGEEVVVTMKGNSVGAKTDKNGRWEVQLPAMMAGGPFEIAAQGKTGAKISDVYVGEVWLCSGQSNMAMTVARSLDFEKEQQAADFPLIRQFKVAANATPEQQSDCGGAWAVCNSETVGGFSAAAYFFARKLHQDLKVPVGIINSSWGGTDVAAWTSLKVQKEVSPLSKLIDAFDVNVDSWDAKSAEDKYQKALAAHKARVAQAKAAGKNPPRRGPRKPTNPANDQNRPANLFNGMIHPLVRYSIRGAIWYQGERNSKTIESGQLYETQLNLMITDWRSRWQQGDFQFITVQLPNFKPPQVNPVETDGWVMVRESELRTLRLKNTGIAITVDVGMEKDIHPKNKQAVGQRLALWALGTTYKRDIVYSGPLYSSQQIRLSSKNAAGKERPGAVTLHFDHVGDALKTSDGEKLRGFAIAGEDRQFYPGSAYIRDDGTVMVSSPKVPTPVAVRYGWAPNPDCNLVNAAGLPASPFRTDRWAFDQK